jgi:alkylation response protein AidB-like acyl-CoA dehydrogenase
VATDPAVREELIATVRRFVERDVVPVASELEHADEYPESIIATMRDLGLFGVTIPEEYDGLGLDLLTYCGVIEELSAGWMTLSGVLNTHVMCANLLKQSGTEEQKQALLPRLASGDILG